MKGDIRTIPTVCVGVGVLIQGEHVEHSYLQVPYAARKSFSG
jgi:hypothetical protein